MTLKVPAVFSCFISKFQIIFLRKLRGTSGRKLKKIKKYWRQTEERVETDCKSEVRVFILFLFCGVAMGWLVFNRMIWFTFWTQIFLFPLSDNFSVIPGIAGRDRSEATSSRLSCSPSGLLRLQLCKWSLLTNSHLIILFGVCYFLLGFKVTRGSIFPCRTRKKYCIIMWPK